MGCGWEKVTLGDTGLVVNPLGLSASYGANAADVEYAFECGVNYFYWGSIRRDDFGRGLRNLAAKHREKMVIVVQTYTRVGFLMRPSVERALRFLGTDYTDFVLLGWWNEMPWKWVMDAAVALIESGKARHVMISCHNRPTFKEFIADPRFGAIMVRYNAGHPGAEQDVFPYLETRRPGVVAYTATRWGTLLNPSLIPSGEAVPRASDCYRFVLSNSNVDMCLIGPKDREQLSEALLTLDRGPMDADELAWMRRVGGAIRNSQSAIARHATERV